MKIELSKEQFMNLLEMSHKLPTSDVGIRGKLRENLRDVKGEGKIKRKFKG